MVNTQDIETLVEAYRVKLGFLPWHEHAAWARANVREANHRTGKTTQIILTAIAASVVDPKGLSLIITMHSEVDRVRRLVRDTAKCLDVDASRVHVRSYRDAVERRGGNWYATNVHRAFDCLDVDHHPNERRWIHEAIEAGLLR